MSAVAPFVTEYASATPYITEAEFLAAPTALEVTDLIPGGTQAQQDRAITDSIIRASSWADRICEQVLSSTVNVERDKYRVDRYGYVNVPLKYKPVLEVQGAAIGFRTSQMVAVTDFTDVEVYRNRCRIPVWPLSLPMNATPGAFTVGSRLIVDITYVNGWVCTTTAAQAGQAATSITVASGLGIYPGSNLTISDGVVTETVQVASTYTIGQTTVPLTSGLLHAHAAGVSVGNLPARAKEAVILLTSVIIQTRGSDAIILESLENPVRMSSAYGAMGNNVELARDMLKNLGRVW